MAVQITIRDIPEGVHDELKARAARKHQSMEEYLRAELEQIAAEPTLDARPGSNGAATNKEVLEQARQRVEASGTHIPRSVILDAIHADRK